MKNLNWACIILALGMGANTTFAESKWSYKEGDGAPEKWAEVHQDYQRCSGYNQSPINITNTVKTNLTPLKFNYQSNTQTIVNNGHTVQINFNDGGELHLDNDIFTLKQFHLHTPSENQIEGKSYPLEAHFVHANAKGDLAVVGIMYAEGEADPELAKLWTELPKTVNAEKVLTEKVKAADFLPKDQAYYRFNGSLTTPPCTEGVRWIVIKEIQSASSEQIKAFADLMEPHNSRPVQPVNARIILE